MAQFTVKTFADAHGLTSIIQRAFSFHPGIDSVWNTQVEFSDRLQRSAGYFHGHSNLITLHYGLKQSSAQDLYETFLHELAHAMQWKVYREVNHGASWWEMMHQLGQVPKRTHSIAACSPATAQAPKSAEELGL